LNYNHYIPTDPQYTPVIQSIWQVDHSTIFQNETIVPKGIIEVIFNFSGGMPILAQAGDHSFHLPACFISGFSNAPIQVRLPRKQVFLEILFQPLAVSKIFGTPAGEFANLTIDLTLVDNGFRLLWEALAEKEKFADRVDLLLGWVKKKCFVPGPREYLIHHFLNRGGPQDHSVKELAAELCYSTRQLSRIMTETTGMNTEAVLLYKKYLHALQLLHDTELSLTAIAFQCQFADQSHFIKSFKTFTHITPGEYRRNKSLVRAHLYKDVR
jgi:AraC-like DNA-binding protein